MSKVQEVILRALSGRQSWLQVADVLGVSCGIGSWGGWCLSLAPYVRGLGATRGTGGAGGGSCCLRSAAPAPSEAENLFHSFYDYELLADIEAADCVVIRRPVDAELATGDGLTLEFLLDDRDDMRASCYPSVILPKAQIQTGFYLRGPVPFKLRIVDDQPEGAGLVLYASLCERARVRVYTETARRHPATGQPVWVDQIVVVTEPLDRTPA